MNAAPTLGGVAAGMTMTSVTVRCRCWIPSSKWRRSSGLLTTESTDTYAVNGSHTGSNYGVSLTYASIEDGRHDAADSTNTETEGDDVYTAINAYYTPDAISLISVAMKSVKTIA